MTLTAERLHQQTVASLDEIRASFPALERVHEGHRVAYFDGPGGTQVPSAVVDAMADYLLHHNANTHWGFPTSAETDAAIDRARRAMADFFNAGQDEIVFGANMTTLTFQLSRTIGRRLAAGDAIVVTELDHHANIDPWRALERERGVVIHQVKMVPETGELDWADLDRCLTDHRVKLLAIGAASNALGTINDVPRAVAMAREAEALSFVDAVHFAPHHLIDVREWGCDFLACSAYKFYGPHVGVLYGRKEQLDALDVPKLQPAPDSAPEKLETGTQNHEGIVGTAAAVEYLASLVRPSDGPSSSSRRERLRSVFATFHERGAALLERLWAGLAEIDGVKIYGPPPSARRTPTLAFTLANHPAKEVSGLLATKGIFVSHGSFYAMTVAARLEVADQGFVRLGCACYTTDEEVERVIEGVRAIAQG